MYKYSLLFILAVMYFFTSFDLLAKTNSIKQIVIFGDSYSDNGNTFNKSSYTYPGRGYFLGHFTNGPNWSEYLSVKLGIDTMDSHVFRNYAYGQAQIRGSVDLKTYTRKTKWTFTIPDLSGEIDEYLKDENIDPFNSWYFLFIGTNDVLNYKPITERKNKEFVNNLLYSFKTQVSRLEQIGARHIVIFKLRDLKRFPLSKELAKEYKHDYLKTLEKMSDQFNNELENFYQNDKKIHFYDTYAFDKKIYSSINKYKWKNQTVFLKDKENACYQHGGNYIDYISDKDCLTPWAYWFFDRIHPTTYIDYLMSENIYTFLIRENLTII
jgi:phospholipase/lecithinase/hemolysin